MVEIMSVEETADVCNSKQNQIDSPNERKVAGESDDSESKTNMDTLQQFNINSNSNNSSNNNNISSIRDNAPSRIITKNRSRRSSVQSQDTTTSETFVPSEIEDTNDGHMRNSDRPDRLSTLGATTSEQQLSRRGPLQLECVISTNEIVETSESGDTADIIDNGKSDNLVENANNPVAEMAENEYKEVNENDKADNIDNRIRALQDDQQRQEEISISQSESSGDSTHDESRQHLQQQQQPEEQEHLGHFQPDNGHDKNDNSIIYRVRQFSGKVVNDDRVQTTIIVLIVLNSIMMGVATADFVTENPEWDNAFTVLDRAFLIIFTIELAFQLIYHGYKLFFDSWLVFDFIIVVFSWALESFQIVRAFRIFRAFRLIARLSLLKDLIEAVFRVIPNMAAISVLLALILYIYAVLCTELFSDLYETGEASFDYFGRLDNTVFTLFQMMTLDWSTAARETREVYKWSSSVFVPFIVVTAFIVYNLIVAVVCDTIRVIERVKAERKRREKRLESVVLDPQNQPPTNREHFIRLESIRKRLSTLVEDQNILLRAAEEMVLEFDSPEENFSNDHLDHRNLCMPSDNEEGDDDRNENDSDINIDEKDLLETCSNRSAVSEKTSSSRDEIRKRGSLHHV